VPLRIAERRFNHKTALSRKRCLQAILDRQSSREGDGGHTNLGHKAWRCHFEGVRLLGRKAINQNTLKPRLHRRRNRVNVGGSLLARKAGGDVGREANSSSNRLDDPSSTQTQMIKRPV
jgi:hypothetical protein